MPYLLVKGTFRPDYGQPDGDSVRFKPDNPVPLFTLPRQGREPNVSKNNGTVQLRYEGIDALEKQASEAFSALATQKNLALINANVTRSGPRGYILANRIDSNGRPICFVYNRDCDDDDGASVYLEADRMSGSVNHELLKSGMAYPLFYDTLYADLRTALAAVIPDARRSAGGLWSHDRTREGVTWSGKDSLPGLPPIFPKLWRRLEKYTQDRDYRDDSDTLDEFINYLKMKADHLIILSEARFADLDDIVVVAGQTVKLPHAPEDLIFKS